MAGLATVFGSGAMTNSMPEIENNDVIFVIGSNTKENHPIVALRMLKAVRKGAKIIVADPRKVPLVKHSHLWLQQIPGTDVALLNSMMHVIVKENLIDERFVEKRTIGFEEVKKNLEEYTPEYGERITGIPKEKIIEAARIYGKAERAGIYYTMGITQHSHGTDNVYSLANLVLMTGNIGKESSGLNPLRGQNNVQGSSDMGCDPSRYPGYQKVTDPKAKEKFEKEWGVSLPDKVGLTAVDMVDAAEAGKLKAMYIMGENPLISDPDIIHTKKALENLDFLVVQDIFMTETAELADVVLPAAVAVEKRGTFTNTERRVQRVRKAIDPPGNAREDSWIIIELGKKMGYKKHYRNYDMEEVFLEAGRLWPALAGMNYNTIMTEGVQWPCPTKNHPGTPYLFKDGFTRVTGSPMAKYIEETHEYLFKETPETGKALFSVVKYRPSSELPDDEYPLVLTTGRQLFHYHTGSMTRRVKGLDSVSSGPYVEINPTDAEDLNITKGDMVKVSSRRGDIELNANVTDRPDSGVVFIPFHFREAAANVLTNPTALDPVCKIPELKVCAVRVEKA